MARQQEADFSGRTFSEEVAARRASGRGTDGSQWDACPLRDVAEPNKNTTSEGSPGGVGSISRIDTVDVVGVSYKRDEFGSPDSSAKTALDAALWASIGATSAGKRAAALKAALRAKACRDGAKAFAVGGREALARAASLGPGSARFGGR